MKTNLAIANARIELTNRFRHEKQSLQPYAFTLLPHYLIHFTNSLP